MARIGLVYGGRSVEHRVSVSSARTVLAALHEAGHEVLPVGVAQDGGWLDLGRSAAALAGEVEALEPSGEPLAASLRHLLTAGAEVVFPVLHGTWGEDGTLQGLCEMLDLPYVGAGVTASAIAMDKLLCKRQLASVELPIVEFESITTSELEAEGQKCLARFSRLPLPLFVKPSRGGSSVGVSRVVAESDLLPAISRALEFDDTALIERGIAGRELECSVLGDEALEASAVGEIVPGNEFYDYEDKYLQDKAGLQAPADLPPATAERVRELAVQAFAAIGGWGMARVDLLLEGEDRLYVNEINTLPGFTRISMYPKLWEISGLPLPRLVDRLVEIALARHDRRRRLDDSIKAWLANLHDS